MHISLISSLHGAILNVSFLKVDKAEEMTFQYLAYIMHTGHYQYSTLITR